MSGREPSVCPERSHWADCTATLLWCNCSHRRNWKGLAKERLWVLYLLWSSWLSCQSVQLSIRASLTKERHILEIYTVPQSGKVWHFEVCLRKDSKQFWDAANLTAQVLCLGCVLLQKFDISAIDGLSWCSIHNTDTAFYLTDKKFSSGLQTANLSRDLHFRHPLLCTLLKWQQMLTKWIKSAKSC